MPTYSHVVYGVTGTKGQMVPLVKVLFQMYHPVDEVMLKKNGQRVSVAVVPLGKTMSDVVEGAEMKVPVRVPSPTLMTLVVDDVLALGSRYPQNESAV